MFINVINVKNVNVFLGIFVFFVFFVFFVCVLLVLIFCVVWYDPPPVLWIYLQIGLMILFLDLFLGPH
jgi:hypothetical protein